MIYITSDTHFNHQMLIDNNFRPFSSIKQMNTQIIKNWNKKVKKGDIVYHLGDVSLKNKKHFDKKILPKLNGTIIFIRGNHDPINISHIKSIIIQYKGKTFELVHNPLNTTFTTDYVLHGHFHINGKTNKQISENKRFYNVNMEFHKYKPKPINEIFGEINQKIYK